jgi:hypothetical protein
MPTWSGILEELQKLRSTKTPLPPGLSPFDVLRRKYVTALAQLTKRNVIVYASKWTQGVADPETISINAEDIQGFMEVIHGLPPADHLDLILHLPGGSAEVTEAIVSYVRSRFSDVRVFVPQAAMSAATMLACSANRIVMGAHSFLGPIDPQFVLRTDVGVVIAPAHAILEQFALAQKQCQDPALLPSWIPILRQYGPSLIIQCQLASQLSESLVSDWLGKYMFQGDRDGAAKGKKIAEALGKHADYKSHSRFISRDKLKSLGFVIDDLEADQALQDAVLSVFHICTHTFGATPATKMIENQLGKAFIKLQQQMSFMMPQPMMIPGGGPQQPQAPALPPSPPQPPAP